MCDQSLPDFYYGRENNSACLNSSAILPWIFIPLDRILIVSFVIRKSSEICSDVNCYQSNVIQGSLWKAKQNGRGQKKENDRLGEKRQRVKLAAYTVLPTFSKWCELIEWKIDMSCCPLLHWGGGWLFRKLNLELVLAEHSHRWQLSASL